MSAPTHADVVLVRALERVLGVLRVGEERRARLEDAIADLEIEIVVRVRRRVEPDDRAHHLGVVLADLDATPAHAERCQAYTAKRGPFAGDRPCARHVAVAVIAQGMTIRYTCQRHREVLVDPRFVVATVLLPEPLLHELRARAEREREATHRRRLDTAKVLAHELADRIPPGRIVADIDTLRYAAREVGVDLAGADEWDVRDEFVEMRKRRQVGAAAVVALIASFGPVDELATRRRQRPA